LLEHSAFKAFVTYVARTACEQTRDVAFRHRTTIATGTGSVYLMRGSLTV
jgi:hypothetical protein